jgi:hypothetical protein
MRNSILSIAAGLLVAVALQVAGSAAASAPDASTSGTRTKVRIHLKGTLTKSHMGSKVGRGRFTLSGVTYTRVGGIFTPTGEISDRGTFVDRFGGQVGPRLAYVRSLRGAKGTIWVTADRPKGNWIIIKGSVAYAGLRGIGRQRGTYAEGNPRLQRTIDLTMTGTLSQ